MSLELSEQLTKENDFEQLENHIIEVEEKYGEEDVLNYLKEIIKHLKEEIKNEKL